ncbi:MAG: hypothetical protein ACREH5_09340, partial [Candidatus Omnitrophota bacterium]
MLRKTPIVLGVAALLSLTSAALPSDPTPNLPAGEILKKAIARAKEEDQQPLSRRFSWTEHAVNEKLENDGKVKERAELEFQWVQLQGKPYRRLVRKNGRLLSGDEVKKEADREKKFLKAIAKPPKPRNKGEDNDLALNEDVVSRFHFTVIGTENINGRPAYLLTFLPKTTGLPEKRQIDRFVNRLTGKVWIDTQLYSIARLDMHLTEPVNFYGGIGSLRALDMMMEFSA